MTSPTTAQFLRKALGYISAPETWCKWAWARDKDGQEVPVMSEAAVAFSSHGALLRAAGSEDADVSWAGRFFGQEERGVPEMLLLRNSANPNRLNHIGFNELKSHAEVLELWREAILLAEFEHAAGGPMTAQEAITGIFAAIPTMKW